MCLDVMKRSNAVDKINKSGLQRYKKYRTTHAHKYTFCVTLCPYVCMHICICVCACVFAVQALRKIIRPIADPITS